MFFIRGTLAINRRRARQWTGRKPSPEAAFGATLVRYLAPTTRVHISGFLILAGLLLGCEARWHRVSVSSWVTKPLPAEGIVIELPAEIAESGSGGRGSRRWFFPPNAHDENAYIMVFVERTTTHAMEHDRSLMSGGHQDAGSMHHADWQYSVHPSTSAYDATEYRRDLVLPDGEIVRLNVLYFNFQFTREQQREDAATIRRMPPPLRGAPSLFRRPP